MCPMLVWITEAEDKMHKLHIKQKSKIHIDSDLMDDIIIRRGNKVYRLSLLTTRL